MCNDIDQYENVCKDEFEKLHALLIKVDESIRGNGRTGLVSKMATGEVYVKLLIWAAIVQSGFWITLIGKIVYDFIRA